MSSRKIFNFKSEILREKTYERFGYYPEKYGEHSAKFVVAICRYCGEEHEIRKGFFNKSDSACHKKCKIKEMKEQKSPFSDPEVIKKVQKKLNEKYGEDRKEIRAKISKAHLTKETKEKTKKTNIEKYGVENVFQSEEIKNKIKKSNVKRYGCEHHMKNKEIQEKTKKTIRKTYGVNNVMQLKEIRNKVKQTNIERYGCQNPMQNKEVVDKGKKTNLQRYGVERPLQNITIMEKVRKTNMERYGNSVPSKSKGVIEKINNSFKKHVEKDPNENFKVINALRNNSFWDYIKIGNSLENASKKFGIEYGSLRNSIIKDEFIEKYRELYKKEKSWVQKEIFEEIKSILNIYIKKDDRKTIYPYELDIYIPSKQFAIEFNGNYWHSEHRLFNSIESSVSEKEFYNEFKKIKNRHYDKMQLCEEKGIRLFQIFEHQWEEKKYQILNFIKTILNSNKTKVAGRKCKITNFNAKQFINNNHIQGNTQNVIQYFNLEYENEIVASMTASKHHRGSSDDQTIVLSRLCFKNDINVQGGSSKLFKYFKEWAVKQGYNKIISWSDNCWTQGNIYKVLGFELENELRPDYFYWDVKNHKKYSKQSQKKSSVNCPEGITEVEWCHERGLFRIWTAGMKKWIYNLK